MPGSICPADLIPMDIFCHDYPLSIHLAYKDDKAPNIFGKIYHNDARLWLHRDLAAIVLLTSKIIESKSGYSCLLYDGLRTMEAQEKMRRSNIAQKNPHWLEEPGRLLSPPGAGAHPRGMAIDLSLRNKDGTLVEMGTVFDHLAEDSSAMHNPAHRDYPNLSPEIIQNRALLTDAMMDAAQALGRDLLPLPQEWWDFRLPAETYNSFAPLSDDDLPGYMRMVETENPEQIPDYEEEKQEMVDRITAYCSMYSRL